MRRRIDRQVLRLQGLLDSSRSDKVLPWFFAAITFLGHAALHAARIRALEPSSGQAPWVQAAWQRTSGGSWRPMAGTDPTAGSAIAEPILRLSSIVDAAGLFVVLQALAIGLAIIPLWRLAREQARLRVGATTAVIIAFALAPALHRANLGSFHPELLAMTALIAAFLRALEGRWIPYALLVAFVLACRADLGLTVAVMGVVLITTGRKVPGIVSAVAGTAWTFAAHWIVQPREPDEILTPAGEYVARSTGPLGALDDIVLRPLDVLGTLLSEPSVDFLIVVLAPLIFLPLMAPRRLVMALPALVLAIVADATVQEVAGRGVLDLAPAAAHIAPALAFVFIALVFALERMGEPSVSRVNVDRRILLSLLAGAVLLFVAQSPSSPYREPWGWGSRDAADGARLAVIDSIPDGAAVASSPSMSAQLAERPVIIELPPDPAALTDERIAAIAGNVDLVAIDMSASDTPAGAPIWTPAHRARVLEAFADVGLARALTVGEAHILSRAGPEPVPAVGPVGEGEEAQER